MTAEQKIGYKGTDENLKCKDQQYEIGKTYFIDDNKVVKELPAGYNLIKDKVEICSKEAIHYVNNLDGVFKWYPDNGKNRYFKIEILGNFVDTPDKSAARCIKFLEEIPREEIERQRKEKEEERLDKVMKLETVKKLQTVYPHTIIAGSISLYLQGVRLKRFGSGEIDLDIVTPFFTLFENSDGLSFYEGEDKSSGNDFDNTVIINGVKADVRIDNKEKYEIVEYKGFKYKIIPLCKTIEAKARYSLEASGQKHRDDLFEMILKK